MPLGQRRRCADVARVRRFQYRCNLAGDDDLTRTARSPRRVLMISCAFPPIGGAGVQRSAKFAKYLPRFGWRPIVWAVDSLPGLPRDATLLADLPPGVTIHRTGPRGLQRVRRRMDALAVRRGLVGRCARAAQWRVASWSGRAYAVDDQAAWARAGVRPLGRLVERDRIDALYSTFSPASNHWLALALKRRFGLPWIADFRDLWTDDPRYREANQRRRKAHRELEQEVLETADVVIGVTPTQTEILARHVATARSKFVAVTNGFDPDDFARGDDPFRPDGRFVLAHVGRFDRWRTDDALFAGLRRFGENKRGRVSLRIVGHATAETLDRVRATGMDHEFVGYVSHAAAIREMRSADLLLLLSGVSLPKDRSVMPGKTFEYLATGRPIVFVGSLDSEPDRLIQTCQAGLSAPPDAGAIADALHEVYERWRCGCPLPGCTPARCSAYSRVELTARLAALLDGLVHPHEAHAGRFPLATEVRSL